MRSFLTLALIGLLAGCADKDLRPWQANPLTVEPPVRPNWVLAAPPEANTAVPPMIEVPVFATGPAELLGYLESVALAEDGVVSVDPIWASATRARAYVHRSAVFGFPDVISVAALDLGAGDAGQRSSLVVYSRAVYGYSDLGINAERIERWLSEVSKVVPIVAGRNTDG